MRRHYNARNVVDPILLENINDANQWLTGVPESHEDETIFLGDFDFTWDVAVEASGVEENHYGLRGNTSSLHTKRRSSYKSIPN